MYASARNAKRERHLENDILEDFREDFGTLIEMGFVATKQGDEKSASDIFYAAATLDPDSPAPVVGIGYIHLNKLELEQAEEAFKEALVMDPEHHLAQAFLGISYLMDEEKRKEGERLLKDAVEKTDDPTIKELGSTSLQWATQDLKKSKAPFFGGATDD